MIPVAYVEAYSSFAYAVEPMAYEWEGETRRVAEVVRAWKSPGERHFVVRDDRGLVCELVYDQARDRWFLKLIQETTLQSARRPK